MKLTKQTDFSLRVLIYLAQFSEPRLVQAHELCEYFDISANHISKVITKLGHLGLIETRRGKGGGIALAMPAGQINLADVVTGMEPNLNPVDCKQPLCRISPDCQLKGILDDAVDAFVNHLRQFSLADLAIPESRFIELRTLKLQ